MKLNHLISVRYKAVGRDTPGPACCRQKGVVSVGNFVDQLEQAEARGIFARWYVDANFRKLNQKFFLGLGFGIKLRSWFDGEHSSFTPGMIALRSSPAVKSPRIRLKSIRQR